MPARFTWSRPGASSRLPRGIINASSIFCGRTGPRNPLAAGVFSVSRMTRASARTTARTEIPGDVLDGSAGGGADMVRPLSGKAVPPDSAFHDGGGGNGQDGAVLFFAARRHRGNLSCRGRLF